MAITTRQHWTILRIKQMMQLEPLSMTADGLLELDAEILKALTANRVQQAELLACRKRLLQLAGESIAAQIELGFIDINDYK